jgi:hypothetical protein
MAQVTMNSARLAYEEDGQGKPIVLLPDTRMAAQAPPATCELYAPKKKSISSSQLLQGSGSSKGSGNGAPGTTT